jgi:hypothetical protein
VNRGRPVGIAVLAILTALLAPAVPFLTPATSVAAPRTPARCGPPPVAPTDERFPVRGDVERLRLSAAHALATGRGQRIAVIDTGVAPHPRLAGRLIGLADHLEPGGEGLDDCDGHGTAVAGLIAASADPGDDLVGVAPAAQVLAVRQFSASITGDAGHPTGDLPSLAAALLEAVRGGATVVNVSGAVCLLATQAATVGEAVRAALRRAIAANVVVVAAAGNIGGGGCAAGDGPPQVSLPGWYGDDVLAVAAVGHGVLDPVAALTAEPAPVRGVETGPDAVVTLPRKAPDPEPRGWPLAALALLLAAAGAAALRLRPEPPDLPAGAQPDHAECAVLSPRRPGPGPPPPHRASAPWEAVAARPREPARRP